VSEICDLPSGDMAIGLHSNDKRPSEKTTRNIHEYLSFHGRDLANISDLILEIELNYGFI
jgi:hypothetical protein